MVNEKVLVSKDLLNELGNKFKKLTGENKKFTIQEMINSKINCNNIIVEKSNIFTNSKEATFIDITGASNVIIQLDETAFDDFSYGSISYEFEDYNGNTLTIDMDNDSDYYYDLDMCYIIFKVLDFNTGRVLILFSNSSGEGKYEESYFDLQTLSLIINVNTRMPSSSEIIKSYIEVEYNG